VPFTLVHVEKYRTEDKSRTEVTETKDHPEKKQTKQNTAKLIPFDRNTNICTN